MASTGTAATAPPLTGVRIIEIGQVISAPYAGQLLADLGAQVTKVEPPTGGDSSRDPAVTPMHGASATFITFNRGKRSVALDLKTDRDRKILDGMVADADVVLTNSVPKVAQRLGLDAAALRQVNPSIITCSIQGFRSEDARADDPTYDLIHQALSGFMTLEGRDGDPPLRVAIPIADLCAAHFAVQGVLAAVIARNRTGHGDHVEVPMYDAMLNMLTYTGTLYLNAGTTPGRWGSEHEYVVPWQAVTAADGDLVLAVRSERFWTRLCPVIGRDEWLVDDRFSTNQARLQNRDLLRELLDDVFSTQPIATWLDRLGAAGVPVAPVRSVGQALDAHAEEAPGLVGHYDDADGRTVHYVGNPLRFQRQPLTPPGPPPELGEHGTERAPADQPVDSPGDIELDDAAVGAWLHQTTGGPGGPVRAWLLSGGRSNLTYGLEDRNGTRFCLRRPPLGADPATHQVLREYRILDALQDTAVLVPTTVGSSDDSAVVGAPFFVTGFVDGIVCNDPSDVAALDEPARAAASAAMVDALLGIHAVDLAAAGLDRLAKHDEYVARQLRRFRSQLDDDDVAQWPLLISVADALAARIPAQQTATIVHGDYKLPNVMLGHDGQIRAVLDWELTTLGDPLADLGWLLASWLGPDDDAPRVSTPPTRAGGFATPDELVARYAAGSDLDLTDLDFYVALAEWKWACINIGTRKRFARGAMGTEVDLDVLTAEIGDRLARAATHLALPHH